MTRTEYLELLDRNSQNDWGLVSDQSDRESILQNEGVFGTRRSGFTRRTEVIEGDTHYVINPQDGELYVTKKRLSPKKQSICMKMWTTPDGDWDEDGNLTNGGY